MNPRERAAFVAAYTMVLTRAWSDDDYVARLERDPGGALTEQGLTPPDGVNVLICRDTEADPNLDAQIDLWENGPASGSCVLYVPHVPKVSSAELTEADLELVAGGDVNACTCCSPCCSCG